MDYKLRSLVAAALTGSVLMGVTATAAADSTTDIVNALVTKGVLTEEEGALLTKGRTSEVETQKKKEKKLGLIILISEATCKTVSLR